ncbi:3'-5' exoribonuclease 1 [Anabarilius grahami]|uniref:3'-5' exoribonuclease 1 n=1 Tax=Anabarilius grahami TaxID=495550 RepID=A0A3N0YMU9_ANAGA|nr:3'-5' exoribonuclease 1 [Anabarilius grahami]
MEAQKETSQPANKTSTSGGDQEEQCCSNTSCENNEEQEPSSPKQGDFSDPVYKEIAIANGTINRMNKNELLAKCVELKLDTRGVKDVLKKRLKNYYKKQKLMHSPGAKGNSDVYFDYICVVDFEATCEENNPPDYLHEIIEFPMVLIDTHTLEIKMVDDAKPFNQVLKQAVSWLQKKELGRKYKYTFLTDGSWDMGKFLNTQCKLSRIKYPQFARKWINIRKSYGNFYKVARAQTKLICMLENLGMEYDGRPHCGLDDSRNIARIAIHMLKDGCQLRVNECLHSGEPRSVPISAPIEGAPAPKTPKKRD